MAVSQKALVVALFLVALLAARSSAQTRIVQDGRGVVLNPDGSISVVSNGVLSSQSQNFFGGEVIYTTPSGTVYDWQALQSLAPGPAEIPDVPAASPDAPAASPDEEAPSPKEDEAHDALQQVIGVLHSGRKLLQA